MAAPQWMLRQLAGPSGLLGPMFGFFLDRVNGADAVRAVARLAPAPTDDLLDLGFGGGVALPHPSARIALGRDSGTLALLLTAANGVQGMAMPALNAMMSRRTPPSQQGELQGLTGSMSALAFLTAQLMYNSSLSYFISDDAPFYFAGAPFIIATAVTIITLLALFALPKQTPNTE